MPGVLSGWPHVAVLSHLLMWTISYYGNICCVAYKSSIKAPSQNYSFIFAHSWVNMFLPSHYSYFCQQSDLTVPKRLIKLFFFTYSFFSSSLELFFFLCACYMVWTAFPTRANVKQTLTNLPVNSSHHQSRGEGVSLAQLGLKHVVKQMFLYSTVTANL